MKDKLKEELQSFQGLWKDGTTLAREGWEKTNRCREFQDIDGIYNHCIRPYVNPETTLLEIGANGGGWTIKMLNAKRIICFDALTPEHNGFYNRIPKRNSIEYYQVKDFECNELEDNSIDYVFSYDVFCHISYSGAKAYIKNLYPKLKKGANCFIMIADINKYHNKNGLERLLARSPYDNLQEFVNDYDGEPYNGRWYFYGIKRFCASLVKSGYSVVSEDVAVELDKLNPIIHFVKGE